MPTKTVSQARAELYGLVDQVAESHRPVLITGKRANSVLVSENDWNAIQETLYLMSIQGLRESIVEGMKISVKKCRGKLDW